VSLFEKLAALALFNALLLVITLGLTTISGSSKAWLWRGVVWSSVLSVVYAAYLLATGRGF
jgi:type IV secretory pathway VirB2 component (pilin)